MKLLFDQNLSPKLAVIFSSQFQGSIHIQSLNLGNSEDISVWNYAKENNYTIVTKDMDFNNMASTVWIPTKNNLD
jgi:predicted nuclease of predicted toxin-antitoxin system